MNRDLAAALVGRRAAAGIAEAGFGGQRADGREETGPVEGLRRIEAARGFLSGVLQDLAVVEPTLLISESHRGAVLLAPKRAQAFAGVGEPHEDTEEGESDEEKFLAQETTEEKGAQGADHSRAPGWMASDLKVITRVNVAFSPRAWRPRVSTLSIPTTALRAEV